MRNLGIGTVCFAGEQAYHGLQSEVGTGGCLFEVAGLFANSNFYLKGIEGCVYPLNPPKKINRVLEKIYMDTIQLPQISL